MQCPVPGRCTPGSKLSIQLCLGPSNFLEAPLQFLGIQVEMDSSFSGRRISRDGQFCSVPDVRSWRPPLLKSNSCVHKVPSSQALWTRTSQPFLPQKWQFHFYLSGKVPRGTVSTPEWTVPSILGLYFWFFWSLPAPLISVILPKVSGLCWALLPPMGPSTSRAVQQSYRAAQLKAVSTEDFSWLWGCSQTLPWTTLSRDPFKSL